MSKTWYPRWNFWPNVEGEYIKEEQIRRLNLRKEVDWVKNRVENILPIDIKWLNRFLKWKD